MKYIMFEILKSFSVLCLVSVSLFLNNAYAHDHDESGELRDCLKAWGKHPFDKEKPEYRVFKTSVKVLGIGSNVRDSERTDKPELVLVKPSVSVLSKMEMHLLNPNGWYCLDNNVNVASKTVINLHCDAHLANAGGDTTIAGSNKEGKGTTVFGKIQVKKVKCRGSKKESDEGKDKKAEEDDEEEEE